MYCILLSHIVHSTLSFHFLSISTRSGVVHLPQLLDVFISFCDIINALLQLFSAMELSTFELWLLIVRYFMYLHNIVQASNVQASNNYLQVYRSSGLPRTVQSFAFHPHRSSLQTCTKASHTTPVPSLHSRVELWVSSQPTCKYLSKARYQVPTKFSFNYTSELGLIRTTKCY